MYRPSMKTPNRQLILKLYIMSEVKMEKFVDSTASANGARKDWLSVLSKAKPEDVLRLWQGAAMAEFDDTAHVLRPPETGMVMVRGRTGGAGDAFNLGEMTVTRCAMRLAGGQTGIGYVAGRNKQHARIAALVDAMMQSDAHKSHVEAAILTPLKSAADARNDAISRKAKATQVEFFTMVRDRKA
jgi:alpha-D-ribose 1-methylphosphonate 5-triphosphate synthase subunit PhnG